MDFWQLISKPYQDYQLHWIILEFLASFFGIVSVYFSIKKHIWVYPIGIISTIIYVYLLFVFGLLGDMLINFYYSIMSIYAWVLWASYSDDNHQIKPKKISKKEIKISLYLFLISFIIIGLVYYFRSQLDAIFNSENIIEHDFNWANYVDIFTSSVFMVGMWLMAKKCIENWFLWILGNFISIPMYINKGLYITSFQYFIFTIMAIFGYLAWKKSLKN